MSDNLSRGVFNVTSNDPLELNAVFQRIRDELDEIQGLRGRAMIFDRARVDDPAVAQDALTLGDAGSRFVDVTTDQTVGGQKTFTDKAIFQSEVELDGDLNHDGTNVGFYDTTPVAQPTTAQDVLDALIALGLHVAGAAVNYYGEIYAHSVADTITISVTGQANKVQITSFDTNGESLGTTPDHTNDHITIDNAGKYFIAISMGVESTGGSTYQIGVSAYKNNGATEFEDIHANHNFDSGAGSEESTVGLHGIATLAAGDTIEVWIWNNTNTNDVIIDDITLDVIRIGD